MHRHLQNVYDLKDIFQKEKKNLKNPNKFDFMKIVF